MCVVHAFGVRGSSPSWTLSCSLCVLLSLSLSLSLYLSFSLSLSLPVSLSPSICVSIYLSITPDLERRLRSLANSIEFRQRVANVAGGMSSTTVQCEHLACLRQARGFRSPNALQRSSLFWSGIHQSLPHSSLLLTWSHGNARRTYILDAYLDISPEKKCSTRDSSRDQDRSVCLVKPAP